MTIAQFRNIEVAGRNVRPDYRVTVDRQKALRFGDDVCFDTWLHREHLRCDLRDEWMSRGWLALCIEPPARMQWIVWVIAQMFKELVNVVKARVGKRRGNTGKRVVARIAVVLDVKTQAEQQPLGHLDPKAVVSPYGLLTLVGDQLDDVLDVLDFVRRPNADAVERVQAYARTVGRRRLELVDALAEPTMLRAGRTPSRRLCPDLAFEVMNDGRALPRKQRRDDQADGFT